MSRRTTTAIAALASTTAALAFAGQAQAADATYTISKTTDEPGLAGGCASPSSGACTLRGAVAQAIANNEAATIKLTTAGEYGLSSPLVVSGTGAPITIHGLGPAKTTVKATGTSRVFEATGGRGLVLQRLTVTGGRAAEGAGVSVSGDSTLYLSFVRVTGNTATGNGGGILANGGRLVADRSTIDGNSAAAGSALAQFGGADDTTLTNVTVAGNTATNGAAIFADTDGDDIPGTVDLTMSTIARNVNADTGAAAGLEAFEDGSTITVRQSIADQGDTGCDDDGAGEIDDAGYNLDSGNTCFSSDAGSLVSTPAGLQPNLRYSAALGGVPALAPAPGSKAIDAITAANCGTNLQDAREFGDNRPIDGNGDGRALCDIGAVEYATAGRDFKTSSSTADGAAFALDITNGDAPISLRVEYGTTTAYGATTDPVPVAYAAEVQRTTLGIGGLAPATTYHYRIVSSDGSGTFYGPDRTVMTKAAPVVVGPAPAPTPDPTPALTAKLGKLATLTLKTVATKGFAVRVTCSAACRAQVDLTTTKKLAKKLKLKGTRLARVTGTATAGKAKTLKVKLSKRLVKRLRKAKVKQLTLTVKTTPTGGGESVTAKKTVTVKG